MPGFKIEKVLHGIEVKIHPAVKAYETKIHIAPRFRPKKFKYEVILFPEQNNDANICDKRYHVTCAYFNKGLAKRNVVLDEAYLVQGGTEKTFHQTMKLIPAGKNYDLLSEKKASYLVDEDLDVKGFMQVNDIAVNRLE